MALALRRHPQIFEKSRLKDGYRAILNQAQQDGAVLIRDTGDENLYIVREDIFGAYENAHEEAQDFAQLAAAVQQMVFAKRRRPDRLHLGRLSWAGDLSQESFRMFVEEYVDAYVHAVHGGQWSALRQLLVEWRDTAAVERDPELMARIMDTGLPEQHQALPRPAETEDEHVGGTGTRGSAAKAIKA